MTTKFAAPTAPAADGLTIYGLWRRPTSAVTHLPLDESASRDRADHWLLAMRRFLAPGQGLVVWVTVGVRLGPVHRP
ncbi:hypothetical protein DMH26_18035 [Streptomyces sp. WAC 05379]|nr:hypothetical protein DMH26_18035 [Streptomyces sp. WAC 05379]